VDFERFEKHLEETNYDVIHFNFGLNDIFRGRKGAWHNPVDQYAKDLEKIVTLLKANGAKVIWATTTPIPANTPHNPEGDDLIYNAAAAKVMNKNNIQINDLHSLVTNWEGYADWKKGDDVHFNGAVYSKLAEQIAKKVTAALVEKSAAEKKSVPGGLSSKKGKGKIFPPNSKHLKVAGHDAYLALPQGVKAREKTPWLWYCPSDYKLPGKLEQWMMKKCLDNGIAVAGIDVRGDFGTPAGRKIFTAFHKELTEKHGLTKKVCLLARSYGGTQMYNWAAEHPESVACLAGIYPVCNLASYPGLKSAAGKYKMPQEQFVKELKKHNPIDRLAPLAKAKVPIYHNTGDIDTLVPPKDNTFIIEKRYKALGGDMTVTIFKGQGHNYWTGFFEDEAMAAFIIKHAKKAAGLPKGLPKDL
jgi:pimeloyl-ACP methyl ester carboxylesterase